ncbi:DNA polymerase III subunit chi [Fertoebacter nigrum]|uniref:DNA polymerase III subunit chi n=1 Tax=Fertoeibacter niger TaxID=2656921 RepID=A0A8X8KMD5_9RHOB|nr:DNA polymerase III subunit chi [Fertoeibacter niger]NUB42855.1 DNA polymerase III subunit chi [Fertoeibacter niger]
MGVVMFYHLTRSPPEETAQLLLGRALVAGWRVMLRGTDAARLDWWDQRLWLGPEEGFLPHGLAGGPHDADQPVLLGRGEIGNGAQALMLVDGAAVTPDEARGLERVWLLFDGQDDAATAAARVQWKALTGAGLAAQYWSEETGKWQKKAESAGAAG